MAQLPKEQLDLLKAFVTLLKTSPAVLQDPPLAFFREYLESLGAKIPTTLPPEPTKTSEIPEDKPANQNETEDMEQDDNQNESDSEPELDMDGVIKPDTDIPQDMGNSSSEEPTELTDEKLDEFNNKRTEALAAFCEADWLKAIDLFTDAIRINSNSAAVFAKRGKCYVKLNRPNACIRDCDRAIQLNPDSAVAYKFRGRAHRLLGNFIEAAKDLRLACRIDFDEVADEWLKEVTPNAKKLEEHQRKKERKQEEKDLKEKKEKIENARKAREEAYKKQKENPPKDGGMPGGMEGLGGLFQDPELMTAFQDIATNPANISKYQNNPKVMNLVNQMMRNGGGGLFGQPGMQKPGGFEGMGDSATKPTPNADDQKCSENMTSTDDLD